jgi:peptide-methionine (R)-S-oxide reductase
MALPVGMLTFVLLVTGTLLVGALAIYANLIQYHGPHGGRPHGNGTGVGHRFTRPRGRVARRAEEARSSRRESPVMAPEDQDKIRKTAAQWRAQLSELQYEVARCGGTEPPFTGCYYHHHDPGTYTCVCCGLPVFGSSDKYDSGSGWPSFTRPLDSGAVTEIKDISYGMVRTEIICSRCEAHLGHVFDDGPEPSGLRYCINSASLDFLKADSAVE